MASTWTDLLHKISNAVFKLGYKLGGEQLSIVEEADKQLAI